MRIVKIRLLKSEGGGVFETEVLDEFDQFGEHFIVHKANNSGPLPLFQVSHEATSAALLRYHEGAVKSAKREAIKLLDVCGADQLKAKIKKAEAHWAKEDA